MPIEPVDKLDAYLLGKGHLYLASPRTRAIAWADRKPGRTVIWGRDSQGSLTVYQTGKTVIVVRELHRMQLVPRHWPRYTA